jgi:hypothetical protein
MAGTHDEAAYGEENCRRRAKRFDIIASLRSVIEVASTPLR